VVRYARAMFSAHELALVAGFLFVAMLYSAVGHAGATGYLALMAIAGVAPATMKPTALVLNLVVASVAVLRYHQARLFPIRDLAPLIVGSIPAAFVAGSLRIPDVLYRPLLAVVLAVAAARLITGATRDTVDEQDAKPPRRAVALLTGGAIGALAGATGTGGGVFLTPIVIARRWATTRAAAGLSAGFILANSAAGLIAQPSSLAALPNWLPAALTVGLAGALIGTELGARRAPLATLRRLLGGVMLIAAVRLLVG